MPYAIMRFAKRKGGPASALEKHHERQKEKYASNPDIDQERSHLNYHLVEPRLNITVRFKPGSSRHRRKIRNVRSGRTV